MPVIEIEDDTSGQRLRHMEPDNLVYEPLQPGIEIGGPMDGPLTGVVRTQAWDMPNGPVTFETAMKFTGLDLNFWKPNGEITAHVWKTDGENEVIAYAIDIRDRDDEAVYQVL